LPLAIKITYICTANAHPEIIHGPCFFLISKQITTTTTTITTTTTTTTTTAAAAAAASAYHHHGITLSAYSVQIKYICMCACVSMFLVL
jgi:hypothetical protein